MEKTEILEKIKEAEKGAEETISNAEEEKKKTIANAKLEARKIREDAEKEADKVKNEIIDSARGNIEQEKSKLKEEWSKRISDLESKGKQNIDEAVEYMYKEFIGMVENA
ncbi:MAG: ATP synthase archaeal subunit H [Archaeoglobaceae archaeon]